MCGIAGAIGYSPIVVRKIINAQKHRGPDGQGFFSDGVCSLGHRRLAIIDLSKKASQPMTSEDDNLVITFNGEIYNYKELRQELKTHHHFKSESDTEVILHLYEDLGEKCLSKLRGIFAFAIWDRKNRTLFAARDRLGVKPLIYTQTKEGLIFASELKAILKTGRVGKVINRSALSQYFLYGSVQTPETLVENIFKLPPACFLSFRNKKLKIKKYWSLPSKKSAMSRKNMEAEIASRVRKAVELEIVSDVPVGLFLSGGIDSSILAALARQYSNDLHTLTIGFKEKKYDETIRATQISKHLGLRHKNILLDPKKIISELPEIFDQIDQPSADGINTYIVSAAAKKVGLKVAISGLGGDELFIGYPSLRSLYSYSIVNKIFRLLPKFLRNHIFTFLYRKNLSMHRKKVLYLLLKCENDKEIYQLSRAVLLPKDVSEICDANIQRETDSGNEKIKDKINQFSAYEINNYLNNTLLHDADRMGMANSIEIRVPLLDYKLVETVFAVPGKDKIKLKPKSLLTKPFASLLPPSFLNYKKKGFVLPFEQWLRGELKSYCDEHLSAASIKKIKCLKNRGVTDIWQSFLQKPGSYSPSAVLSLLSFINWYENNIAQ